MLCCSRRLKQYPATDAFNDAETRVAQAGSGSGRIAKKMGVKLTRPAANSVQIDVAWRALADRRSGSQPMRRTGHIRERAPGSFELRYSLGTDPATGKRKIATAT